MSINIFGSFYEQWKHFYQSLLFFFFLFFPMLIASALFNQNKKYIIVVHSTQYTYLVISPHICRWSPNSILTKIAAKKQTFVDRRLPADARQSFCDVLEGKTISHHAVPSRRQLTAYLSCNNNMNTINISVASSEPIISSIGCQLRIAILQDNSFTFCGMIL